MFFEINFFEQSFFLKKINKTTALHLAVKNDNFDIVRLLVEAKGINTNVKDDVFSIFFFL